MTPERFQELTDAYGADPNRWPDDEREAALTLLARSAAARAEIDAARKLDALLDHASTPTGLSFDAAALAARITATPQQRIERSRARERGWDLPLGWLNVAGLAAAAIAGFAIGATDLDGSFGGAARADSIELLSPISTEDALW